MVKKVIEEVAVAKKPKTKRKSSSWNVLVGQVYKIQKAKADKAGNKYKFGQALGDAKKVWDKTNKKAVAGWKSKLG